MAEKVKSIWTRILAFVAAMLSGLIFIFGSLRAVFLGQSFFEYLVTELGLEATLAQVFEIIMWIASFAGWIILAAAISILIDRMRITKIILMIVISTGIISFFIPVAAALVQGALTLQILLNGDATMYLVATLFGIIARLYIDKLS